MALLIYNSATYYLQKCFPQILKEQKILVAYLQGREGADT